MEMNMFLYISSILDLWWFNWTFASEFAWRAKIYIKPSGSFKKKKNHFESILSFCVDRWPPRQVWAAHTPVTFFCWCPDEDKGMRAFWWMSSGNVWCHSLKDPLMEWAFVSLLDGCTARRPAGRFAKTIISKTEVSLLFSSQGFVFCERELS